MITDTLDQLKSMLSPLGIYNTDSSTTLNAELCAYACGINLVKAQTQKLLEEGFVQTAQDFGLELREDMLAISPNQTLELRREEIVEKLSTVSGQWSLPKVKSEIEQTGFDGSILENFEEQRLTIGFTSPETATLEDLSTVYKTIRPIMPAHLEVRSNIEPISWDVFDTLDENFAYFDKLALSFDSVEVIS
ncbi:MAG: DUF2313 domain-containing protein [Clostridia bacterium]|nr:DUF2313 domain-containing protein [Clostridia bacterium]